MSRRRTGIHLTHNWTARPRYRRKPCPSPCHRRAVPQVRDLPSGLLPSFWGRLRFEELPQGAVSGLGCPPRGQPLLRGTRIPLGSAGFPENCLWSQTAKFAEGRGSAGLRLSALSCSQSRPLFPSDGRDRLGCSSAGPALTQGHEQCRAATGSDHLPGVGF